MTIHYHGTPISPRSVLHTLAGHHFCVSFAAPQVVELCHVIGQSVMLDNGEFSRYKKGITIEWPRYYEWCEEWFDYMTTWGVIPDVIDGGEADNDALIEQWPHGERGAPVWHMHESLDRLRKLCDSWPRVCIGSSGEYWQLDTPQWHARMTEAMDAICREHRVPVWLHMLRGMAQCTSGYPFASVDSTDIGRNHNRDHNDAKQMAMRWDAIQCVKHWHSPGTQLCIG